MVTKTLFNQNKIIKRSAFNDLTKAVMPYVDDNWYFCKLF